MEWTSSSACKDQEEGCANYWYQVEREEEDELGDLAEGEGRIDGGGCGLAEHLDGIGSVMEEDSRGGYEVGLAFADEGCLGGSQQK